MEKEAEESNIRALSLYSEGMRGNTKLDVVESILLREDDGRKNGRE